MYLKAAGGSELVGKQEIPGMGWSFIWLDPEGNVVGMFQGISRRQRAQARRAKRAARRSSRRRR